jgi:AcrR family transcriptional regulator
MANQFQETEKFDHNPRTEDAGKHLSEHSAELSRQAYTDVRVNITDGGNPCADALPTCSFEPLSTREQRQAYVREVAAPLFEGSPPLFAYLDRSSYKGENREFDGRVSVHNMHDFLKTYQTMSEMGQTQWPYTEKNAQYVRDLLDFKYPELTGENFAGFSAQALCRRAGLTKMSVKHYEDYAVLATAWKQALSEDVSFRRDAQANSGDRTTIIASDGDRIPCDVSQPPCPPAPEAPPVAAVKSPCETDADLVRQHDREMRLRLEQMSTFEKGSSYWRMASKFLHAGMRPCDVDDVTNQDINRLTRAFVKINHSTIDSRGLPNPMVHPGDRVPVSQHLEELVTRHDKLARAIARMLNAEQ